MRASAGLLVFLVVVVSAPGLNAQSASRLEQVRSHLKFGEFSAAIELASGMDREEANLAWAEIAAAQTSGGAAKAAESTVARIRDDDLRTRFLGNQYQAFGPGNPSSGGSASPAPGGNSGRNRSDAPGNRGGITEADFEPLIELIKSVVAPDSWDDAGGDGTIMAYPSGVYVDSQGTLHRLRTDRNAHLMRLRVDAVRDKGNRHATQRSTLRKISLNRLERAVQIAVATGRPLDDEMRYMAGMYDVEYLMVLPETGDVVIAGPAGPWRHDADGRAINIETGLPTLVLDDWVVCLRNVLSNGGKYGCKITPRQPNLVATQQFLANSKLRGKAWRDKLRETLGQQDIEVFGMDPQTHAGRVLVEADYRMKLVGMGLEPSIPEVPSYLERLSAPPQGGAVPMDVVRWWFTMNYDDLLADADRQVFSFTGTGVKVLSENELLDQLGNRIHTGKSKGPTAEFARDFTRHFDKLSRHYPIYRELKNLFDLSIVAALIDRHQLDRQVGWHHAFFAPSDSPGEFVYRPQIQAVPRQVDSVINHREITERRNRKTLKHTLVGVSGGVSFDAMQVVSEKPLKPIATDTTPEVEQVAQAAPEYERASRWWWD